MLDPARLTCPSALVRSEPFPLLVARGVLDPAQQDALVRDFPLSTVPASFPMSRASNGHLPYGGERLAAVQAAWLVS